MLLQSFIDEGRDVRHHVPKVIESQCLWHPMNEGGGLERKCMLLLSLAPEEYLARLFYGSHNCAAC